MSWQAVGVLVAMLGVIATFLLNLRSQRLTRKGQAQDRELASNAAARSEAATRLTEEYTRRVVDALEAIARSGLGQTAAPPSQVRWRLAHDEGDTFRLTNVGTLTASSLAVTAHESLGIMWLQTPADSLQPDEALTFLAAVTFGTTDSTITVRWKDETHSGVQTWRYPLPAKS